MIQQSRQLETTDGVMLMTSMTDHGCNSFFPTKRSEWRTGRWVGIGALAMTLGALTLGLVYASRTQPASAVGIGASSPAPSPAPLSSPQRPKPVLQAMRQVPLAQLALAFAENRR